MPQVKVLPSGQSIDSQSKTLLEVCTDEGLPIPFGCTVGKCGVCRVRVMEGKLSEASQFERAVLEAFGCDEDVRLACQARLDGDVAIQSMREPC